MTRIVINSDSFETNLETDSGEVIDILANSKIHKIIEVISLLANRTKIFISKI